MRLYKFRSFSNTKNLLDILVNERLYCSPYTSLNDPFEGVFYEYYNVPISHFKEKVGSTKPLVVGSPAVHKVRALSSISKDSFFSRLNAVHKVCVCSLSSDFSDIRLWSHYADSHTGVAIEIDFDGFEGSLCKVDYSDSLPEFSPNLLDMPKCEEILSHKTHHWSFEQEYRVIQMNTLFVDIKGRIKRIIFGTRADPLHVKMVESVASGKFSVVHAKLDHAALKIIEK